MEFIRNKNIDLTLILQELCKTTHQIILQVFTWGVNPELQSSPTSVLGLKCVKIISFYSLFRSCGECLQHGEQLSPERLQSRAPAEIPQWHHHWGGAGAAHDQICGRRQEKHPWERGLAKHCLWGVQNWGHGLVQDPSPAVKWGKERWPHPAQCLLPWLGEDRHGRSQSHQVPRRGGWDPRLFGPFAFQCWCSSWPVCEWQNCQALVSSGRWG